MSRVKKRRFLQIALAFYIKKFRRPLSSDKNEVFRKKGADVGSVFTEAQPGSTLTALCFEIAYSLLRKIVEREFQILTIMNFMNHWKSNVIFNDLHPLIRL